MSTVQAAADIAQTRPPDIIVEMWRGVDGRGAVWDMRATAHGVGYNNADYEQELDTISTWLSNTVTFLMGCVAADQQEGR